MTRIFDGSCGALSLWDDDPVPGPYCGPVRFERDQSQQLVVHAATPGTSDYEKFDLLSVIGAVAP
jgi:hypothetical protein